MVLSDWGPWHLFVRRFAIAAQRLETLLTRTVPVEVVVNEIVSLANTMRLEVDNNDIDDPVEEKSQELTIEEFMELLCVSQQEVVEESLSKEEETAIFWLNKRSVEIRANYCIVQ
ncbi:hypothetical protein AVEN_143581-1 [Araneus ventricosus]|uniref:Uncharacterized protein n=1 Tax=Araneus ventricosus TaxID=182803 RepID=A0A4Y2AN65_ARAVE|nr:hypothetical protein AVEN_143581-1 [Araneus ventricosus]